jgi:hypothetical protein
VLTIALPFCSCCSPCKHERHQPASLPRPPPPVPSCRLSSPSCPECQPNQPIQPKQQRATRGNKGQPRSSLGGGSIMLRHHVLYIVGYSSASYSREKYRASPRARACVLISDGILLFSQLFLCLSRACLGKIIVFAYQLLKKGLPTPHSHAVSAPPRRA